MRNFGELQFFYRKGKKVFKEVLLGGNKHIIRRINHF